MEDLVTSSQPTAADTNPTAAGTSLPTAADSFNRQMAELEERHTRERRQLQQQRQEAVAEEKTAMFEAGLNDLRSQLRNVKQQQVMK